MREHDSRINNPRMHQSERFQVIVQPTPPPPRAPCHTHPHGIARHQPTRLSKRKDTGKKRGGERNSPMPDHDRVLINQRTQLAPCRL